MSALATCRCGAAWVQHGNRTGHCSACHRTFTSLAAFDAHQRMLDHAPWQICVDPASVVDRTGRAVFVRRTTGAGDSQPYHWALAATEADMARLDRLKARRAGA